MGQVHSAPPVMVEKDSAYITMPQFAHGLPNATSKNSPFDQQVRHLEAQDWSVIFPGFDFRRPLEEFVSSLRHFDYGELAPTKYWCWHVDKYFFVVRGCQLVGESSINETNGDVVFYIDFRSGIGYRRPSNGNSISINVGTRFRLSELRVAQAPSAVATASGGIPMPATTPNAAAYSPVPTTMQPFDGVCAVTHQGN
jgi:hypothetical protein